MNSINVWMRQVEELFAVTFLVYVIGMHFIQKNKTKAIKLIDGIILSISFLLLSDVLAAVYDGNPSTVGSLASHVSNFVYFLSNYTSIWLMIHYARELVRKNGIASDSFFSMAGNGIYALAWCFMLINLVKPFIYVLDGNNTYQRGPMFFLAFFPAGVLLLLLGWHNIVYRAHLSRFEKLLIFSYIVFPMAAEVLQVVDWEFSWQPLAMAFLAFIMIVQNLTSMNWRGKKVDKSITQEGKELQTRIILFVSVTIIVFFGFITRIAIGFASTQMNKEIEAHYQMLADKTTEQASAWIVRETQTLLNQKASLEIINNFDHDFLTEYFTYVVEDYNYDKYIYDMYFVNTNNEMSDGSGYEQDPSIDFRERDWYRGAQSTDNACYTVPYVDVDTGQFVVTVSVKVFDRNRRFVGVLALDIFVEKLFSITQNQNVPRDSYVFLVDNELGIVTHPGDDFQYVNESPQNLREVSFETYKSLASFLAGAQSDHRQITFEDYDGVERAFFFSKVDDCNWYIVAAISQDVIDESRQNMSKSIFVALIICLVSGILITLWATNSIIRKLTEAQEEARAASEAKSRFLANMSHEIRTPINAVLGMDEILLRECRDENVKEYALNIQSAGQALLSVVNDILDFSKIESDRLELVPVKYDLGELVGSCINLITLRAKDKNLTFKVEREKYLPKQLFGDMVRIRQIISNLLTNAVKYTKEGGVVLFVGWNRKSMETGELVIRVKDTGMGIKQENIGDLFTSFKRLDEKKNRNIEGTGLGLSITKQLIELMNGHIEVESEYGKGSEFIVVIPQKVMNGENTESFEVAKDTVQNKPARVLRTRGAHILVVDDVRMNLQVVKGLLKNTGLEIDVAERGIEAVRLMEKNAYDVVFLDHMMPEMDGVETLRLIRKDYPSIYEKTPIIMLTANAVMGVEEEYKNEGFAGYLSKPIDRDSLCKCIEGFLPKEKIVPSDEEGE